MPVNSEGALRVNSCSENFIKQENIHGEFPRRNKAPAMLPATFQNNCSVEHMWMTASISCKVHGSLHGIKWNLSWLKKINIFLPTVLCLL